MGTLISIFGEEWVRAFYLAIFFGTFIREMLEKVVHQKQFQPLWFALTLDICYYYFIAEYPKTTPLSALLVLALAAPSIYVTLFLCSNNYFEKLLNEEFCLEVEKE